MRAILLALVLAAGLSGHAGAYDIDQLLIDARAHHGRMMTDFGDLKIEQNAEFVARGGEKSGMSAVMYRKGNRWRNDGTMTMQGNPGTPKGGSLDAITLFDGKDCWSVAMGMKMKLPSGSQQSQSSVPAYWVEPTEGSRVVGEETLSSRACWIVEGPSAPAGSPIKIEPVRTWIDKLRFVLVQSETKLSGKTIRTVFTDYRKVKGSYEIPYQTDVYSDGHKTMTARIVKLETGVGLSDDLFDPEKLPGAGPAIDTDKLMKQAEEMRKKIEAQHGTKKKPE